MRVAELLRRLAVAGGHRLCGVLLHGHHPSAFSDHPAGEGTQLKESVSEGAWGSVALFGQDKWNWGTLQSPFPPSPTLRGGSGR